MSFAHMRGGAAVVTGLVCCCAHLLPMPQLRGAAEQACLSAPCFWLLLSFTHGGRVFAPHQVSGICGSVCVVARTRARLVP